MIDAVRALVQAFQKNQGCSGLQNDSEFYEFLSFSTSLKSPGSNITKLHHKLT
ncbi:MAG: hypothetical protein U9O53_01470 [archaeon]|nr:hypothetical protein [archaeon]